MKIIKIKPIADKLLQCIFLVMGITIFCYSFTVYIATEKQTKLFSNMYIENKYIKITDNYNTTQFSNFLSDKNSLNKLKTMHENLNNDNIFQYLEIDKQNIEFIGNYSKSIDFVSGNNKKYVNQPITDEDGQQYYITPLNSFQISEKAADILHLNNKISEGKFFENKDFFLSESNQKIIPVILGNSYVGVYKIGDEIEGKFLQKIFKFKVIGFLCKSVLLPLNYDAYNLDNSIIMPFINCKYTPVNEKDYKFQTTLYSLKTEGYISYSTNEHYVTSVHELENLAQKNNLDYSYISNDLQSFTKDSALTAIKTSKVILLFSIIIMSIVSFVIIFMTIKYIDSNLKNYAIYLINGVSIFRIKVKIFSLLLVQFLIAIVVTSFFSFNYFKSTVYFIYFLNYIFLEFGITFLFIFSMLIFINFYINKLNICLAIRRKD